MLQLKEDLKALRQELKGLRADFAASQKGQEQTHRAIERLAFEVQRTRDHDDSERRMLAPQLENELLKFARRLPPGDKTE